MILSRRSEFWMLGTGLAVGVALIGLAPLAIGGVHGPGFVFKSLSYLSAAITVAVAARVHGRLWTVVPVVLVAGPGLEQFAMSWQYSGLAEALGVAPMIVSGPFSFIGGLTGIAIDLAAVALPSVVIRRALGPVAGRPIRLLAVASAVGMALVVLLAAFLAQGDQVPQLSGLSVMLAASVAAGLGASRARWAALFPAIGAFLLTQGLAMIEGPFLTSPVATAIPLVVLIVTAWPFFGSVSMALDRRPVVALVVMNILNVADAVLTSTGLARGAIEEVNPIIVRSGFAPKLVAGGIASYLIYRLNPKWLIVPISVLSVVLLWQLVGLALLS